MTSSQPTMTTFNAERAGIFSRWGRRKNIVKSFGSALPTLLDDLKFHSANAEKYVHRNYGHDEIKDGMSEQERAAIIEKYAYTNHVGGPRSLLPMAQYYWFKSQHEALSNLEWSQSLSHAVTLGRTQFYSEIFFAIISRNGLLENPYAQSFFSLRSMARNVASGFVLGQKEQAIRFGRAAVYAYVNKMLLDTVLYPRDLRAHHFIIALFADWQKLDTAANAEASCVPEYAWLPKHWRAQDGDALIPALLAACDRHTQQCRSSDKIGYDFDFKAVHHFPYEILMLFRLREYEGLENPTIDHPLMEPPFDRCPEPVSAYSDRLIEQTYARLREDWPLFDDYIQAAVEDPTSKDLPILT